MRVLHSFPSVGELVAEKPGRSKIFERLGIDYCCGGKRPLDEVCAEKGLDPDTLLKTLHACDAIPVEDTRDWRTAGMSELCDHIVATHHAYLRAELPELLELVKKVATVHELDHPELQQVRATFEALKEELEQHMMKEENILFPMCRQMEHAVGMPEFHCGSVNNPIRVMEHEHDIVGQALQSMRTMTNAFKPPANACSSYRLMLEGLEKLEADIHQHVHKENNILFPMAAAQESALLSPPLVMEAGKTPTPSALMGSISGSTNHRQV